MSVPKLDSADNSKPQSTALYYLLKLEEKTKIGSNAAYFDKDDTGFIQSAALLQDIDTREFKKSSSQPNSEWISFINKGTKNYGVAIFNITITWAKGVTDRQTEINAATAFYAAKDSAVHASLPFTVSKSPIWGLIKNDWEKASSSFIGHGKAEDLFNQIKKTKSSDSWLEKSSGGDTDFVRVDEKNIVDQINKIYGPTKDVQRSVLFDQGYSSFKSLIDKSDYVLNSMAMSLGPIFTEPILNNLKNITSMPHAMSGVIQNYLLVSGLEAKVGNLSSSFSGLPDTPSGYTGGMFIRVSPQATGLEFIDITGAISSEDIAWKAYGAVSELPTASSKHGMLAHVHGEGAVYLAHGGNWVKIYPGAGGGGGTDANAITGVAHSQYGESLIKTTGDASTRLATLKGIEAGDGIYLTGYNNTLQVHAKVGFTGLYDTPSSYKDSLEDYQMVVVDAGGISYRNYATSFTGLQDTLSDLTNEEGKLLVVDNSRQIVTTGSLSGMVSFPELKDTPNNYEGGKYLAVDSNGTKIHYTGVVTNFTGLSDTPNTITDQYYLVGDGQSLKFTKNLTMAFSGLTDTPNTITDGYYLVGTSNGLGFTTVAPGSGGTAANFIGLPDTPSSYAGEQGKVLRVNPSQNGVEFFSLNYPTAITGLSDTPSQVINDNVLIGSGGQMVFTKYISGFTGLHDTPSGYSTFAENALRVNAGESGIEYYIPSFSGLSDTPSSSQLTGSVGLYLTVEGGGAIGTDSIYFTGLGGVDSSEISANKFIQVSGDGSSLIFTDIHFTGLQGVPTDWSSTNTGKYLALNSAGNSITFVDAPGGGGGASTFLGLADVAPSSFDANKFVVVNSDGNGLTFNQPSFTGLKESPRSLEANRYLAIDSAGTGIVFTGAATAFTGLSDTPSSIGTSGQALVVNNQADGISYTGLVTSFTELSDTPDILDANKILVVSTDHKSLELKSLTFTGLSDTPSSVQTNKYLGANGGGQIAWLDGTDAGGSAPTFSGLSDTPSDFHWSNASGSILMAGKDGVVFSGLAFNELVGVDPGITGAPSYLYINTAGEVSALDVAFTGLSDTPSAISGLKYLRGNSIGNALEFVDLPESSSVSGFTGLHDTPSSYDVGKFLKINAAGDAIEYGVPTFTGLFETPDTLVPNALLKVNPVGNGFVWATGASGANVVQSGLGSSHFTGLLDTPTNIAADEVLVGTKFNTLNFVRPDSLNLSFTGLHDTPSQLQEGKHLEVSCGHLMEVDPTDTFLKLKDTQTEFSSSDSFGRITVGPDNSLVTRHTIDLNFEYSAGEETDLSRIIEHAALSNHAWYQASQLYHCNGRTRYYAYTQKGLPTPDLDTWAPEQYSNKGLILGSELEERANDGTLSDVLRLHGAQTIYLKFKNPLYLDKLQISLANIPGISDNTAYEKNYALFNLIDSLNNNALVYGRHRAVHCSFGCGDDPGYKDDILQGLVESYQQSSCQKEPKGVRIIGSVHEGLTDSIEAYSRTSGLPHEPGRNAGAGYTRLRKKMEQWPLTEFGGWGNMNFKASHNLVFGTDKLYFRNLFRGYEWNWFNYKGNYGPRSETHGPQIHNGAPDLEFGSVVEPLALNGIVIHPHQLHSFYYKPFAIEDIKIVASSSPISLDSKEPRYVVSKVDRDLSYFYDSKKSNSATLYLKRGQSYRFNISRSVGSKFYIYENSSKTKIWSHKSLTVNGIDSGSMVFDVPLDCPEVLYYGAEGTEVGSIIIPKGRPLVAGEGIQITEGSSSLSISATGDSGTADAVTGAKTLGTLGGGEASLLGGISDSEVNFKKIVAGTNITLDSDSQSVVINSAGGGTSTAGITGASNLLGDGAFAMLNKVSTNNPLGIIEAKSIKGGEGIRVTESNDKKSALILATGLNRFITGAENAGSKNTLLLPVTDQTIKVKTIEAGDNITISSPDSNTLKIESAAGGSSITSSDGVGESLLTAADPLKLRKLKAGSNVSLTVENKLLTINATSSSSSSSSSDGGVGNNPEVKSESSFDGIIPDSIVVFQADNGTTTFNFRQIALTKSGYPNGYIQYVDQWENWIEFHNNSAGGLKQIYNNVGTYTLLDGATSLQDVIDNKHAVYYSGSAGAGGSSAGGGGGGDLAIKQGSYVGDGKVDGIYIPLDFIPAQVDIQSAGSPNGGYLGTTTLHLTNSGKSSAYRWQSTSRSSHSYHGHIADVGTISGKGFLAKGHSNDSVFNVIGNTYHYTAIANKASSTKGGVGSNKFVSGESNFYTLIPDEIILKDSNNTANAYSFSAAGKTEDTIKYQMSPGLTLNFDNDTEGSFNNKDVGTHGPAMSLSGYIASGHAVYSDGGAGGSSSSSAGSSTFLDLTDTPSDFNAGKYLKVSNDGTKLEYKNITLNDTNDLGDGGVGSHTGVQADSNFYRNLPDQILVQENDGGIDWTGLAKLTWYYGDKIQYFTSDYWINFSNNEEGTYIEDSNINEDAYGNNLSLSGYIAKGKAVFLGETKKGFGQYSGIDKGDFEHRVPEYVYLIDSGGDVNTIGRLYAPYNSADGDRFCYETVGVDGKYICFNKDTDGTIQQNALYGASNIAANKVSLSTYIDQGRVHYAGGGDIGSSAAGVSSFLKLTDTPSDFTASKYLKVNAVGDALEFTDIAGGGGGGTITGAATAEGSTKTLLSGIGNRKWDGTSDGGFIGLKGLSAGTNVELTELNNEIVITAAGSTETYLTKNINLTGILAAQSVGTVSDGKSVYNITENNIASFKRIKAKDSSIVLYDSQDGKSIEIQASPPPLDLSSFISGTENLGLDAQGHKVHTEVSDQIAKFKRIKAGPSATITSDSDYLTIDVNACALAASIQSTAKPPEVVYYQSSGILSGSSLSLVDLGYANDKTNPIGNNCEYLSLYIDGNRMSSSNMEGVNDWRPAGTSGVVFHMGIPSGSMISASLVV